MNNKNITILKINIFLFTFNDAQRFWVWGVAWLERWLCAAMTYTHCWQ
jgi:hypothetical protein